MKPTLEAERSRCGLRRLGETESTRLFGGEQLLPPMDRFRDGPRVTYAHVTPHGHITRRDPPYRVHWQW